MLTLTETLATFAAAACLFCVIYPLVGVLVRRIAGDRRPLQDLIEDL